MTERRRVPRRSLAIRVEPLDGGTWMVAHDIGLGGMMVTTRRARWPGELVRVCFSLPGGARPVRVTCRVVDLVEVPRGVGLALRFLRLPPATQLELHRFIDQRKLEPDNDSLATRAATWIRRMVEDCGELGALARPG
jgi:hypothetical protein